LFRVGIFLNYFDLWESRNLARVVSLAFSDVKEFFLKQQKILEAPVYRHCQAAASMRMFSAWL